MRHFILKAVMLGAAVLFAVYSYAHLDSIPDVSDLLTAPTSVDSNGGVISASSKLYLDHANGNLNCAQGTIEISLDVNATRGTLFKVDVISVWAHQEGQWWNGKIAPTLTREINGHKLLVARGCSNKLIKPLMPTDIVIKLTVNGRYHYLRTTTRINALDS
jgi:hypothetical protein